jgi:hypothetical protein
MRKPRTAVERKRIRWEGITGNLRQRLDQLPHLKGPCDALMGKVAESRDLEQQIGSLQGQLTEALEKLDQVALQGEEIRGRLTAALQAEYGFKSLRLQDFGLKPRHSRGRRKKVPSAETSEPAAPPTDGAE